MPLCHQASIIVILYIYRYYTGSVISSSISTKCCCKIFDSYKEERDNYSSPGFFTLVACII